MTYKSTLITLIRAREVLGVPVELDGARPQRVVLGTRAFVQWYQYDLPTLGSRVIGSKIQPVAQVYALLWDFVTGQGLNYGIDFKPLIPHGSRVWELKTTDIRIFGWFEQRDVFVAAFGDDASRVKDYRLYAGYVAQTVQVRAALGLSGVEGTEDDDVLTDP